MEITVDPTKQPSVAEAALLLMQECRDLLTEIRDALAPPDRAACPACGSTYVNRFLHKLGPDQCSRGACIRWAREKDEPGWEPHWLASCGDCDHFWVEEFEE